MSGFVSWQEKIKGSALSGVIFWLREDLRLKDQPILDYAAQCGRFVMVVYIHHPPSSPFVGEHSLRWLAASLRALHEDLRLMGSALVLRCGEPSEVLCELMQETKIKEVLWYESFYPPLRLQDQKVRIKVKELGGGGEVFPPSSLLYHPSEILTASQSPYRVFSQFWKKVQSLKYRPVSKEARVRFFSAAQDLDISQQLLQISSLNGVSLLLEGSVAGEKGAEICLQTFVTKISAYELKRNDPAQNHTSKLSTYLAFGEITPHLILRGLSVIPSGDLGKQSFVRELAWREFAYYLLYHFPHMLHTPLDVRYEGMPYRKGGEELRRWQQAQSGYPVIDAAMRELRQSGWMHGRMRMVVASFLCKNLLIDWRVGADWFARYLVDYSPAQNSMNWQWVAGCGVDAAPYFRVFNPVLQAKKFDVKAEYIKKWLPELSEFPVDLLHDPGLIQKEGKVSEELKKAWSRIYPSPLVDLFETRKRALEAYDQFIKVKTVEK